MPPPNHHLKTTTSLPDVILTAISLLHKKNPSFQFPPNLKFPSKMSSPNPNNNTPRKTLTFATPQTLSDYLKPRLPPNTLTTWGSHPGTKNIQSLFLEISQGETFITDSNPPIRTLEVVIVKITRKDGKVLVESHQELSNGVVRHRGRPLSEKMKPGETVENAVYRAVKEELGSLFVKIESLEGNEDLGKRVLIKEGSYSRRVEERGSVSYPGLGACYVLHCVEAEVLGLPEEEGEFCSEESDEYGEVGGDEKGLAVSCKKHFWKWVDSDEVSV